MDIASRLRGMALAAASIGVLAASSAAQPRQGGEAPPATVSASADATVNAAPDQVELEVGVTTQAADAQRAAQQNAEKVDRVLAALRARLGSGSDLRTIGYALNPVYNYPREGGEPRITGYAASNVVHVRTAKLEQAGGLIDAAIQAGANNIQSLRFTLKDNTEVKTQALRLATLEARRKAEAIAAALGVQVVRVLAAQESGPTAVPFFGAEMAMRARAQDVATPVEPGTLEVHASVAVTLEVRN
jgi:uncharacterized protein YggE